MGMLSRIGTALVIIVAALFGVAFGADDVPAGKRTVSGKYLSAKDAYERVMANKGSTLFLDVRTSSEVVYVGMADAVDAVVPFVEFKQPLTWDDKGGRFETIPNARFVQFVDAALKSKGLNKSDPVVVMCRSGERSAKAVNVLAQNGYTEVWSVHDGFEGDLSNDGRRSVNGWKNASLPWSYKLDKSKLQWVLDAGAN